MLLSRLPNSITLTFVFPFAHQALGNLALSAATRSSRLPAMTGIQQPLTFNDVFEEEDVDEPKTNTVHHIRANSSIMNMKKILGECRRGRDAETNPTAWAIGLLSWGRRWRYEGKLAPLKLVY